MTELAKDIADLVSDAIPKHEQEVASMTSIMLEGNGVIHITPTHGDPINGVRIGQGFDLRSISQFRDKSIEEIEAALEIIWPDSSANPRASRVVVRSNREVSRYDFESGLLRAQHYKEVLDYEETERKRDKSPR